MINRHFQQPKVYETPNKITWKKLSRPEVKVDPKNRKFKLSVTPKKNQLEYKSNVYLSPLDRIRIGINRRALDLGLPRCLDKSFEANQSFPRSRKSNLHRYEIELDTPLKHKLEGMDKIRVDGSNGLRFTARKSKGCFTPLTGSPFSNSFINSTSESLSRIVKSGINPNKAVFTIDSKTSQILIVNNNACNMLGFTARELCDMQFSSLLTSKNKIPVSALAEGQLNSEDGTMVLLSGKVIEMSTKSGNPIPVSLWIRQIEYDGRCLAVAEPVERRVAQLLIDRNGYVLSGDHEALNLFQIDSIDKFNGIDVQMLIPAIQLPDADTSFISKNIRKQKATGKTQDGVAFPLCLMISFQDSGTDTTDSGLSNPSANLYVVTLWVYTNLSGLLVINEHSIVESCNHHFSMLMFGYPQNHIVGESITKIIPNFGQEYEYLGYIRSRNATLSSLDNDESETETDQINLCNKINELDIILNDNNTDTLPRRASNDAKMCLDFTSKSNNISNDVQNGSIMHTVNSEPIDISSKANNTRYDDFKYMNPIEGRRKLESPSLNINKSFSDNLLCSGENGENNKNVANVYKPLDYSDSSYKYNIRLNSECDIQNQLHPQTLVQNNECDLLTPVNDNVDIQNMIMIPNKVGSTTLHSQETNVSDQKYTSADISAALRGPQESSIENSVEYSKNTPKNKIKKVVTDNKNYITSTPEIKKIMQASNMVLVKKQYTDGKYKGEAIHYDGNIIDIIYTISTQILPCDKKVYCVWIHRDPDSEFNLDEEEKHQNLTLTFNSVASTVDNSLGQAIKVTAAAASGSVSASIGAQNSSRPNSVSLVSQCEEDQVCGEYSKYYTTLKQIGKGAYGYVKMAYRNSDRLLVISKFILKEKLCPNFMIITDDDKKEIPMEIYLLTHVQHPNIVSVYDVFENEKFFQLVMEKHGSGMDLFEFIDRRPLMDEKLGCFIFRQIANAVDYLHKLNILHRDIKDENIIIDQNFHVKLIDFGSATFMQEGKLFSTFYGTTEYCSPEVLAGNKYEGPELEVWSLGVTLYVLMFFENPFLDIEETLRANLVLPHTISAPLEALLFSMLDKDPKTRCTMKQLMQNDWLNQEIVTTNQSFAWIVPCEQFEANPEKYYTGQAYSSMIALSESPHDDSLSLADDDSMIDDEEDKSLPSQTDRDSIKVDISSVLDTKICQLSSTIGNINIDKDFTTTPAAATSAMNVNSNSSGFSIVKHTSCNNIESSSVSSNTNILCNDLKKTNISKSSFEILSIIYNDNRTEYDDDSWEDDDDDDDEEENDDDKDVEDKCEVA